MTMPPDQMKHLEFLQSVITRMASNSFLLKGWAITLVAAILALAAGHDATARYGWPALLAPLFFWGLDAYYLRQERLFRKLYDRVRAMPAEQWLREGNFSMDTSAVASETPGWANALWTPATWSVYLAVVIAAAGFLMTV